MLAKIGLFFAKFAKVIVMGLLAVGGGIWKWITGRKKEDPATSDGESAA
jgi:uncharacterized membrane-anchored protein